MKSDFPFFKSGYIVAYINSVEIFLEKTEQNKKNGEKSPGILQCEMYHILILLQEFYTLICTWASLAGCEGPTRLILLSSRLLLVLLAFTAGVFQLD